MIESPRHVEKSTAWNAVSSSGNRTRPSAETIVGAVEGTWRRNCSTLCHLDNLSVFSEAGYAETNRTQKSNRAGFSGAFREPFVAGVAA